MFFVCDKYSLFLFDFHQKILFYLMKTIFYWFNLIVFILLSTKAPKQLFLSEQHWTRSFPVPISKQMIWHCKIETQIQWQINQNSNLFSRKKKLSLRVKGRKSKQKYVTNQFNIFSDLKLISYQIIENGFNQFITFH